MPDFSGHLRQMVEKMLVQRGRRNASCRVFAPGGGTRTYSVILEESGIREQFFIENAYVERFAETGNEQFVLTYIRAGIRNLDRLVTKKKTARER
ncbi:MAG: hypothetical protein HY316_07235 [Acidobacteria bacterium]|nr:hypothetical protein [Acidobacteriota bacterium]